EQRRERGIVSLPETLGEAIDELAGSEVARKALGPHIFDRYVELKRKEWDDYRVQLSEWELERYLPVLWRMVFTEGAVWRKKGAGCQHLRRRWCWTADGELLGA